MRGFGGWRAALTLALVGIAVDGEPAHAAQPVTLGSGGTPSLAVLDDGAAVVAWSVRTGPFIGTHICRVPRGTSGTGCPVVTSFPQASPDQQAHALRMPVPDGSIWPAVIFRDAVTEEVDLALSTDGASTFAAPRAIATTSTVGLDPDGAAHVYSAPANPTVAWAAGTATGGSDVQMYLGGRPPSTTFADLFVGPSSGASLGNTSTAADPVPAVITDEGGDFELRAFPAGTASDPNDGSQWFPPAPGPVTGFFVVADSADEDEPRFVDRGGDAASVPIVFSRQGGDVLLRRQRTDARGLEAPVATPASAALPGYAASRDPGGLVHLAWHTIDGTFWATTADDGRTWSAPVKILPASVTPRHLQVGAAPDGRGWAAYEDLAGYVDVVALEPYVETSAAPGGSGGGGAPAPGAGGRGGGAGPQPAAPRDPAKLRVLRAGVRGGRLDLLAEMTKRATGSLVVRFLARGTTTSFSVPIPKDGRVRVLRRLRGRQRHATSGIVELRFLGSTRVRPDEVRLRAARHRALLRRTLTRIRDGRLEVGGTVSSRARGVVRVRLGYVDAAGKLAFARYRARIAHGRWQLRQPLTGPAAKGGQLSIQYTGYLPGRVRGEQLAKAVAP